MAAPGSYENPSSKPCWETCGACYRCKDKGRYTKCNKCSGRHDPFGHIDVDRDDYCECTLGVLRWRDKLGRLLIKKYDKNPFKGQMIRESKTQDERDWEAYLKDMRERLDNPTWDPIEFADQADPFSTNFKVLGQE